MKAAVATDNGQTINKHFGHTESFYIYEVSKESFSLEDIRHTERFCTKESAHGTQNGVMKKFLSMLEDCEALFCQSIGYNVAKKLEASGIRSYMLETDIATAMEALQDGTLDLISESQDGN